MPDSDFEIIDHSLSGRITGLVTVKSVKYTAAPHIAALVLNRLPFPAKPASAPAASGIRIVETRRRVSATPLSPSIPPQAGEFSAREHLKAHHGAGYERILSFQSECGVGDERVSAAPPVLAVEVLYALRCEMALKLTDVVFRRTGMGTAACPPQSSLAAIAELMGRELGWTLEQRQQEIGDVLCRYDVLADTSNRESR